MATGSSARAAAPRFRTRSSGLPNLISLARLLSVPLVVWLIIEGVWAAAFGLFVAAGLSDALDGYLARRLGRQSRLGAYLDALADKALLVASYATLAAVDRLDTWLAILVISRDLLIVGGVALSHAFGLGVSDRPSVLGKANTAAQVALVALLLGGIAFGVTRLPALVEPLAYLVAATTVGSGLGYLAQWVRRVAEVERSR